MTKRYETKSRDSLYGILAILFGLSYLLPGQYWFNLLWQILVIVWGILNIRDESYITGILLIGFGSLFILDTILKTNITNILTGIVFIMIGIKAIFDKL